MSYLWLEFLIWFSWKAILLKIMGCLRGELLCYGIHLFLSLLIQSKRAHFSNKTHCSHTWLRRVVIWMSSTTFLVLAQDILIWAYGRSHCWSLWLEQECAWIHLLFKHLRQIFVYFLPSTRPRHVQCHKRVLFDFFLGKFTLGWLLLRIIVFVGIMSAQILKRIIL